MIAAKDSDIATVMVTSAGTIVGQGIIKSLRLANQTSHATRKYRIIAVDSSPLAPSLYRVDEGIVVPPMTSPGYVEALIRTCEKYEVSAVFPGADEELMVLADAAGRFEESGTIVLVEPREVISLGSDKWETYRFLKQKGLPVAESALPELSERFLSEFSFPVVVKPREGHGSLHFHLAHNREELEGRFSEIRNAGWRPMIQQYLPEEDLEFTSGVTVDGGKREVMSSISMRRTLKGGQTIKAFVDDFAQVREAAERVALAAGCRGPVNIQARMSEGVPKSFEINPRFSASCPIRAVAGVNEPDIVFRNQVLKEEIRIQKHEKMICLRFYQELYVVSGDYERLGKQGSISSNESFIVDYF